MKILNLFAGIGGNRTLWGDEYEITAVEYDEKALNIYKNRFPNDIIKIGDVYDYLPRHFKEFDIIWASPPCQTHSRLALTNIAQDQGSLPDMRLYGIIIFLQHCFKGKWIVENVNPYYYPLIRPTVEIGRHFYWSNFKIPCREGLKRPTFTSSSGGTGGNYMGLCQFHNIDPELKIKEQYLKNMVDYKIGKYILDCAVKSPLTMEAFL